ncbi:MAG: fepA [Candidatus Brocadiaceae bacterium]|nr:fepA [Candidatus Brocadiaceae bacterium]
MPLSPSKAEDEFQEELQWLSEEKVVFTTSRHEQKVSETASAVYIITQEDIRRSGANCIPELLRMAPGVNVARIDANKWAISMRGFNNRYANQLLILIDGRSVYTPLFAGTYWDVQDTLLEDCVLR